MSIIKAKKSKLYKALGGQFYDYLEKKEIKLKIAYEHK